MRGGFAGVQLQKHGNPLCRKDCDRQESLVILGQECSQTVPHLSAHCRLVAASASVGDPSSVGGFGQFISIFWQSVKWYLCAVMLRSTCIVAFVWRSQGWTSRYQGTGRDLHYLHHAAGRKRLLDGVFSLSLRHAYSRGSVVKTAPRALATSHPSRPYDALSGTIYSLNYCSKGRWAIRSSIAMWPGRNADPISSRHVRRSGKKSTRPS